MTHLPEPHGQEGTEATRRSAAVGKRSQARGRGAARLAVLNYPIGLYADV